MSEYNGKRVLPYEGSEAYIFVSYSHRDTEIVLPILEYLEKEGFRFWYDEGIDPGSEWPESIASHLSKAKVCIAFMSPDSLKSNNCRREINFALSKNIEFLSVILKPVEMSPGVEMQISTYQSLLKYKYKTEQEFLERFVKVETIQSCRKSKEIIEIKKEVIEEKVEKIETPKTIGGDTTVIEEKTKKVKTKPVKKEKKEKVQKTKTSNNNKFIAIGVIVCLIIGLVFIFMPKKTTIQGVEYTKNESSYLFENVSLNSDDVSKIISFNKAINIEFNGVTFDDKSYELLKDMDEINTLYMINCNGIEDLNFINEMDSLYTLKLENCGLTDDIFENVNSNTISRLFLSKNKLTKVPEGFSEQLRELDLSNNKIYVTKALENYINLEVLNISNNSIISFRGIDNCTKLRELNASNNKLSELVKIQNIIHLKTLDISHNNLSTLSALEYMEELRILNVSGNEKIDDFSYISNSSKTLERIGLQNLTLTNLDILKDCTKLTHLYADNSYIEDISVLINCTSLNTLTLSNNKISDLSSLSNLTKLKVGDFSNNNITTLEGLENMCKDESYTVLSFQNNNITNLNGMPTGEKNQIILCGNPINDISALKGKKGYQIAFDGVADFPVNGLKDLDYIAVYMVDIDISIQKDVEDALGGTLRKKTLNEVIESFVGNSFEMKL